MKSQTKTTKAATTKAARNTPVNKRKTVLELAQVADNSTLTKSELARKFPATTKAAKAASKAAQVSAQVSPKAAQENAPKAVFALVAGTIAQIINKGLRQAIAYHVAKGNLTKVDAGIQLTAQGALLWAKERIENDPARFHEIAGFVHGGAVPKEFAGQPVSANVAGTMQGKALQFPNNLYWGSFASSDMRRAFAALWATKK